MENKTGEWTGRVEISKEEIPGSKRSMHGNTLTYSRLERENLYRKLVGPYLWEAGLGTHRGTSML